MTETIKDSMLFWYPKISTLPIPQPKTEIIKLTDDEIRLLISENVPQAVVDKVAPACRKFGYPCFLRTDLASGKQSWKETCYVETNDESLQQHIYEVVCFNLCASVTGLPFTALVVREYIPMATYFTAFYGEMPINAERRYFIRDHQVHCHHFYWLAEAIDQSHRSPSVANWRELLQEANTELPDEIELLSGYAKLIAQRFEGYWSIDFCRARDGRWILIDMATGEHSWHPDCSRSENSRPSSGQDRKDYGFHK